jgi:hypothetical protein
MPRRTLTEQAVSTANIYAGAYDAALVRRVCPRWDSLSPAAQRRALSYIPPAETRATSNTTTVGMDRHNVAAKVPTEPAPGPITHIRVGTGTRSPAYSRRDLYSPVVDIRVDSYETGEDHVICYGFLATNQGNVDADLAEMGLLTENGTLLNHGQFDAIAKHSGRIINIAIRVGFGPAPA